MNLSLSDAILVVELKSLFSFRRPANDWSSLAAVDCGGRKEKDRHTMIGANTPIGWSLGLATEVVTSLRLRDRETNRASSLLWIERGI